MDCQKEWIDITDDKSAKILKRIIRPGELYHDRDLISKSDEDLHPRIGDFVQIKLIGKTANDGEVFLGREDKPIQYNLFTGECVKGLDLVISTMIKNELCEALIAPDYLIDDIYSDEVLNGVKIPRDQQLLFTIELIDWENEFLSRKNDGGIIRRVLKKGSGYEVPMTNSTVIVNLIGYYQRSSEDCIHKFDERENFKFKLSEGSDLGIVRGLEYAIYRMKIMEKDRVYILRKYLFNQDFKFDYLLGDQFSKLPDDYVRLIYEVELVSFEIKKQICDLSIKERFELCELEKVRGGEFFKQNKFYLSLKCYSEILKAIGPPDTLQQIDDLSDEQKKIKTEFIINAYNNITLCYLKLKMAKEAIKYADWTLQLDSNNLKALYRKGLANYDRNDFKQSIQLFERCLELDPTNKAAKNQIILAEQQIKKYENKEKQIFSNLFQALANDKEIQSMEA